ncbi:DUF1801 domain-containing protein [Pedobacter jamesrossensis]|uniref:DUF1801 domain-containing protein n=1 Tax=Pedobacter jamesrossensis TaxID=1908238 RepID=A0ABV8NJ00_9SPHI
MAEKLSNEQQVSFYIQNLNVQQREIVQTIRQIILNTDSEIAEQIKWNSPGFYYSGEMKPFDAKEYKRDLMVLNLHKGKIMLVLPTGAIIKDTSGLMEGKYTDGRRIIHFKDLDDVISKEKELQEVIKIWLSLIEK